jgi:DNA repair protein RecO (recombination protein O)
MTASRLYRLTGINLKTSPLGEADRLVTILSKEEGLIRAVARGARKHTSRLRGRMEPFMVNDLLISRGRRASQVDPHHSLQWISQAETVQSFAKLGRSLARLTAAQYLGEVTLQQALAGHPQEDLFLLLLEHLERLEAAASDREILPLLTHGLYHLLALGGIAPQVHACHYCQHPLTDNLPPEIGFSPAAGSVICDPCITIRRPQPLSLLSPQVLRVLQLLPDPHLPTADNPCMQLTTNGTASPLSTPPGWLGAEFLLRRVIEYNSDRPVRSASLVDTVWSAPKQEQPEAGGKANLAQ